VTKDLDVFVVGGVGIDTVVRVPSLPLPDQESFQVPPIESYVAHTGHGVAFGCHRLGLRTALADVIGSDEEGHRILAAYAAAGVELHHLTHESGTRRAVNLVEPGGRRLSFYDARHPAGLVPDPLLWKRGIEGARHVHVSIVPWGRHALADAVAAGVTTSTDVHDWDGENPYHREFARGADFVFVSGSALGGRVDEVLASILRDGRARVAVAMDGERGSRLVVPGERVRHIPAATIPGRPVVDSNGAGDSYVAAFLRTSLAGGTWLDAARAGAIAGAYACGTAGTHTSFVDATTLDALMADEAAPPSRPEPTTGGTMSR
jgi:sugar/nucleoside kinase (ribokinase family)